MEKLLNFNESLDVNLLDRVVAALYTGKPDEINMAQKIMHQFKEHPQSWTRVDTILEYSQNPQTKYFALQILEDLIKSRWRILPKEQRDGIKNYIVNLVIKLSSTDDVRLKNGLLLGQSNKVLVQILKQEWPHNWEGFIPEIVGASKTNESLCENNMTIFKLLSEDVFEFSKDQMTQAKIKEMKTKFNNDFFLIYQLCDYIMNNTQKPSLLQATLETLLRFLSWIPLGYIFETNLVSGLISKFLPSAPLRNLVLQCLGEVAGLDVGENQNAQFQQMFKMFMEQIVVILPPNINIPNAYERGSDQDQQFIYHLSLFFTAFFKHHLTSVEQLQFHPMLLAAHQYLVQISLVNDPEIFKICLEYWNTLASSLYYEAPLISQPLLLGKPTQTPRRQLYSEILSKVREVMISRMARPEEVLISEDENGVISRIYLKDTENIALYKIMRETLIFLTHLDYEDTQNIMLRKLDAQVDGSEWGWGPLSTLCWAIGAIAGAQSEEMEKRFLVTVIRNLLELTEMKSGKDNKAVVASNIMFIVGQYPRFLRAHWKFLKTVVNKLFEFMHETHPGVQDMSCDTFLKIARKCKRKFVTVQQDERRPFIDEILDEIGNIISELQDQQVHTFFEAVGHMISAHHDPNVKAQLITRLMDMPNQTWAEIMKQAALNLAYLKQPATAAKLLNILKTNTRACTSLGHSFVSQLGRMYLDMLNVYKVYSEEISNIVATQGPQATRTQQVKSLRSVKSETLRLIETWIDKAEQVEPIVRDFLPPLLAAVLSDYKANIPNAREAEVLSLNAQIVNKCKGAITNEIPRIFDAIFECTLMMISKNFEDFPDFRVNFFNFIRAVNSHCFKAFFMMPTQVFKLVIDSIVWAFKHTMRNISETGLTILMELFDNISGTEVAAPFYQSYFLTLLQDLFVVLTDAFHKSGFSLQSALLLRMCNEVDSGKVQVPLWDPVKINDPAMTNPRFLREHICQLLAQSYPNLSQGQVMAFVEGLFSLKDLNLFKNHLRDFLVQIKEFAGGEDNAKLYEADKEAEAAKVTKEETERNMQIPGMIPPNADPRTEAESMLD